MSIQKLFTPTQLEMLRLEYAKVERVAHDSPTLARLRAFVDGMAPEVLRQISKAGIKWLSFLADGKLRNQLPDPFATGKPQPCLVPGCGGTETPLTGRDGRRYLWCWDRNATGTWPGDHVYVDLGTDTPITPEQHKIAFG